MNSMKFPSFILSTLLLFSCNGSDDNVTSKEEPFEVIYTTANILTDIDADNISIDPKNNQPINGNGIKNPTPNET